VVRAVAAVDVVGGRDVHVHVATGLVAHHAGVALAHVVAFAAEQRHRGGDAQAEIAVAVRRVAREAVDVRRRRRGRVGRRAAHVLDEALVGVAAHARRVRALEDGLTLAVTALGPLGLGTDHAQVHVGVAFEAIGRLRIFLHDGRDFPGAGRQGQQAHDADQDQ
jgi:hypothetical protein